MAAKIVVLREAELELEEAIEWYEARRVGLGGEFLGCVETIFQHVAESPVLHEKVKGDYRRVLVRRFPYAVFYEFDSQTNIVTIYAVFHTSRNPRKWQTRLK